MERKYYLRGLGLGITVTAVIMGIALSGNRAMTDGEIIARAKELGMVENTVLSDKDSKEEAQENTDAGNSYGQEQTVGKEQDIAQAGQDEEQNPSVADHETKSDDKASGDAATDLETENDADDGKADVESGPGAAETDVEPDHNTEEEKPNTVADDAESGESEDDNISIPAGTVRVITINSGDSSYTVAKKLADVGVITSAANFDTFLCENGYDKRIRTGTFSIPSDASDEQIARIVSGLE